MPVYEYRCERGHLFDALQRMSDDRLTRCTTCEAPVQRVFHPIAVHFKGSGFYTTDYGRAGSGGDKEAAEGSSSTTDGAGGAAKKDSGEKEGGAKDAGQKGSAASASAASG